MFMLPVYYDPIVKSLKLVCTCVYKYVSMSRQPSPTREQKKLIELKQESGLEYKSNYEYPIKVQTNPMYH